MTKVPELAVYIFVSPLIALLVASLLVLLGLPLWLAVLAFFATGSLAILVIALVSRYSVEKSANLEKRTSS